ncbi:MAG: flagellar basal body rod C-terminal domain-containing protein [Porticoccaceae bacterium]|jgi:flagellar basal-body rod protein FlgF|nr:flagellar basal body rod C-terminal domain-containing protein [Porticoccaceae bacterium]
MDRLAFTSLAAVQSQAEIRAQITNALANVSTVGFKESYEVATETVKIEAAGYETRFQPSVHKRDVISLEPGTISMTGNPLDIALLDKTVLGIQAENGDIGFTRRGDLRVSASGVIETSVGHLVMGEAGPITAPQGQLISISPDGTLYAKSTIDPETPAVEIGQLMLRDASQTTLIRREDGLFEPLDIDFRGRDFPTGPLVASVQSGGLEGSNVNPIEAMVKMMDFSRSFEAQIKMITEAKSIDETGSSMMRLP